MSRKRFSRTAMIVAGSGLALCLGGLGIANAATGDEPRPAPEGSDSRAVPARERPAPEGSDSRAVPPRERPAPAPDHSDTVVRPPGTDFQPAQPAPGQAQRPEPAPDMPTGEAKRPAPAPDKDPGEAKRPQPTAPTK